MRLPNLLQRDMPLTQASWHPLVRAVDHALKPVAQVLAKRVDPSAPPSASTFDDQTLPIVLGVVIPVVVSLCVFVFLHRRNVKKLRREDLNDPHKSLDFGMEAAGVRRTDKNTLPEMSISKLTGAARGGRGVSMDLGISNPYLLPAELQSSSGSIRSVSRSHHDENDPYRPVALMHGRPSTDSRPRDDKASEYSMSTGNHTAAENAGLVVNARPMSQTFGKANSPLSPLSQDDSSPRALNSANRSQPPSRKSSLSEKPLQQPLETPLSEIAEGDMLPTPAIPEPAMLELPPPRISSAVPSPPEKDLNVSKPLPTNYRRSSFYGDEDTLDLPTVNIMPQHDEESPYDIDPSMIYDDEPEPSRQSLDGLGLHNVDGLVAPQPMAGQRLSVMGLRPLPPDMPDDNPETRANRIRSFYREYFDDSKPNPEGKYEDDYFFEGGAIYDPDSGGFLVPGGRPFAQNPGRRAMTPPPRGPPRGSSTAPPLHHRKYSTLSMGRPRLRGFPSAQKKKSSLPPPSPLHALPTPHSLKSELEIMNPIDFAPLSSFRPGTPKGSPQPYSPSVRPWTPLQSSFDTLTVMPSPYELRKSTTFTALDFAPPPAIRDNFGGPGSDAGSIRSNRSGMSAVHRDAVRTGAYRVSRIPKAAMVTTRDDMAMQLRPQMNMINPA